MTAGFAKQRALDGIDPFDAVKAFRPRKDEVLVAGKDRIDTLDPGQIERGILHPVGLARTVDAGMRKRDDEVGALLLHDRHPGLGGRDDIAGLRLGLRDS